MAKKKYSQSKNSAMYVPGTCNIGPEEIQTRMNAGWIGLIATLLIGEALLYLPVSPWVRLVVFFPAAVGALGFLQAAFQFCVAFGMNGLFNVSSAVGKTESVSQKEFRKQDQQKALQIIAYAVIIGAIIAVAFVYV
jgi:hypothetical protein